MALALKTCGCDSCKNRSSFTAAGDLVTCANNCSEGAPCAYAFLHGCNFKTEPWTEPITVVWRECLFQNDIYTARRGKGCTNFGGAPCTQLNDPWWENSKGKPDNHMDPNKWHQWFPPVYDADGTPTWTTIELGAGRMEELADRFGQSYRCGWRDWVNLTFPCDAGLDYWQRELSANTEIIWKLTIESSTATYVGYGAMLPDGTQPVIVTYRCTSFVCLERNTFTRVDAESVLPSQFFPRVCCTPYSADWQSPCDTKTDACACADSGWRNACLSLSGVICGNLAGGKLSLPRNAATNFVGDLGLDLSSSCISAPSPAPCGYFLGTLPYAQNSCGVGPTWDGTTANNTLAFLAWCDGTDWQIEIYCITFTLAVGPGDTVTSCVKICDTTITEVERCPDGFRGTFSCDGSASGCCPDCDEPPGDEPPGITTDCCPDDPLPATLYATFDADLCAFDGEVVTLTFNGTSAWIGTLTATGCGDLTVRFGITGLATGTPCSPQLQIRNADNEICLEQQSVSYDICPFASVEFVETDWNRTDCPCCDRGNTVTVTVTP